MAIIFNAVSTYLFIYFDGDQYIKIVTYDAGGMTQELKAFVTPAEDLV